jgi:hypothetical protein
LVAPYGQEFRQFCQKWSFRQYQPRVTDAASYSNVGYVRMRMAWIPAQSLRFVAGYERGAGVAVSDVEKYILDPVHDTRGGDFQLDPSVDWALLVLKESIGQETGFATLSPMPPEGMRTALVVLAGYAGLRQHMLSVANDCGSPVYRPLADIQRPTRMLRCGPSLQTFVQSLAFCRLNRWSADFVSARCRLRGARGRWPSLSGHCFAMPCRAVDGFRKPSPKPVLGRNKMSRTFDGVSRLTG